MRPLSVWLCGAVRCCGCGDSVSDRPARGGDAGGAEKSAAKQDPSAETVQKKSGETEWDTKLKSVPRQLLDESQLANGWIQLFDGQTLFGW